MDSVMDGGLDLFINGYLKWIALGGRKPEGSGGSGIKGKTLMPQDAGPAVSDGSRQNS